MSQKEEFNAGTLPRGMVVSIENFLQLRQKDQRTFVFLEEATFTFKVESLPKDTSSPGP